MWLTLPSYKLLKRQLSAFFTVMADGDVRQILFLVNGLLKTAKEMMNSFPDDFIETAKETRQEELFELFVQSAEIGLKLKDWCGFGEE